MLATVLIILIGITYAVDQRPSKGDSMDKDRVTMEANNGVCKICYRNGLQKQCKTGPLSCFTSLLCRRNLQERLCPNIRYCPNATDTQRFPVVVKGTKQDGSVFAVCQCNVCEIGDKQDIIDRELTLRGTVCCAIKRDSAIVFIKTPRGDCVDKGGNIADTDRCTVDDVNDLCSRVYDPVCDEDGNIYANKCRAKLNGVNITDIRLCRDSCGCLEKDISPICVKLANGELQTFKNKCRYICAKKSSLLNGTRIVSDSICKRDRECRIRDSVRKPVCDTVNQTTYGSLIECKCAGACQTNTSFTFGRCLNETACICSRLVSDTKPVCRTRGDIAETFRDRCEALCADAIDINVNTRMVNPRDNSSQIIDGICNGDKSDCSLRDDVRNKCDESDRIPVASALRVKFRLKLCYPDFGNKVMLFDSIREAMARLLYFQCNLTRMDTDEILITAFKPLSLITKTVITRTKSCVPDQIFDIAVGAYFKNYVRIKEAFDCFEGFNLDIIEKLKQRFIEAYKKRDPDANCKCLDDPSNLMCSTEMINDNSTCSDCDSCTRPDSDDPVGYGNADIDTVDSAIAVETLSIDGDVIEGGNITQQGTTTSPTQDSKANQWYCLITFIVVFIIIFF